MTELNIISIPKYEILELDYFITYSFIQHRRALNQFYFLIHFNYRFTTDALAEAIIEFITLISDDKKLLQDLSTYLTIIASISAALLAGFFGIMNQRKISSLEISKIKENARTTYEYEAKKRLYEQLEPILFQFIETSELGLNRIIGIAGNMRHGKLEPYHGYLSSTDSYYLKTTIYRFIAPMAAFRLLQSQLTLVDLSLDPYMHIQYDIAKAVYRTFSDDYALADSGLRLNYFPDKGQTNKEKRAIQEIRSCSL